MRSELREHASHRGGVEGRPAAGPLAVELRRFPYPYRAMLAICSDLDETPDRDCYHRIARFLNTTEVTPGMGPGVGLEVGNTIFFDMAPGEFAYWTTDEAGRALVRALVRSGHVDCIHSFGDLATSRAHAGRALDELARHGLRPRVWIDHAVAATNFGADIMRGRGDVPGAEEYHADLTLGFGVEYVWRGRVTSVIGQEVPRSLRGIFEPRRPARSAKTLAKELAKGVLARSGSAKYAAHGPNDVLRAARLRDGRPVIEFLRSNPYWGGVENAATADGIAEVLTPRMLERLAARGGACVLYTHLGKVRSAGAPFGPATCAAFARLAEEERAGRILVTTTRRLLDYCRARREVKVAARAGPGGVTVVEIAAPARLAEEADGQPTGVSGLTVYVADPARVEVAVNGRAVEVVRNRVDEKGRRSVSVGWPRLRFPGV